MACVKRSLTTACRLCPPLSFVRGIRSLSGPEPRYKRPRRNEGPQAVPVRPLLSALCPDPVKRIAVSAEVFRRAFLDTGRDRRVCGTQWRMVGMIPLEQGAYRGAAKPRTGSHDDLSAGSAAN